MEWKALKLPSMRDYPPITLHCVKRRKIKEKKQFDISKSQAILVILTGRSIITFFKKIRKIHRKLIGKRFLPTFLMAQWMIVYCFCLSVLVLEQKTVFRMIFVDFIHYNIVFSWLKTQTDHTKPLKLHETCSNGNMYNLSRVYIAVSLFAVFCYFFRTAVVVAASFFDYVVVSKYLLLYFIFFCFDFENKLT